MNADIVVEGFVRKQVYPRGRVNPGEFAIFSFEISKIVSGVVDAKVTKDKWYKAGMLTFKGSVPELSMSTKYKIFADLVEDNKYGWGYSIKMMSVCADVSDENGLRKFLSYVLSETQINAIMLEVQNPAEVLKNGDIEALCKIKGIGRSTAQKILDKYEKSKDMSDAYSVLYDYGLTKLMVDKLIAVYRSPNTLIAKLRENPYALIEEVDGIGWSKADAMALKYGIPSDSDFRIKAFVKYYFRSLAEGDGHTWVQLDELVTNLRGLVPDANKEKLQKILKELLEDGTLYYKRETKQVGLNKYRKLEENIYRELCRIRDCDKNKKLRYIDETIAECEEIVGYEYTDEQKEVIRKICNDNVVLLTANAGCGKSSLMYPVTRIFRKNNLPFAQCTLSGKASLNLQEITSEDGSTIHKLLGWTPRGFVCNRSNKLACGAVILDEVSMVGGELFYSLIQAIDDGSKLIMIGDPGQLESIGLCNLISDIASSGAIQHVHLSKIFRQAAKSGIITDSLHVYKQEPIVPKSFSGHAVHGELKDFDIYSRQTKETCLNDVITIFKKLYFEENIPIEDIVVVTARRATGGLSSVEINQVVQDILNFDKEEICLKRSYEDNHKKYEVSYHVGDRVLVTENDYKTVEVGTGREMPIFNGNIGTVVSISPDKTEMTVQFPQGRVVIPRGKLGALQLGYAITAHKSQGSGFKYVIAIVDPGAYTMLTKEWLYTALTRAKKHCYMIGTPMSIDTCIKTTRVKAKQTWLGGLLAGVDEIV